MIEKLPFLRTYSGYEGKYLGTDTKDACLDKEWFINYPIQDFHYNFNDWGFRGNDYTKYLGKPVVLCLGDSLTVNIGGPIEHSWPSILQEYMEFPCLNMGVSGAGNDAIRKVYEVSKNLFQVQYVFVVYSHFHRRLVNNELIMDWFPHNENIDNFNENFIKEASYQFVPSWCHSDEENDFIKSKVQPYLEDCFWDSSMDRKLVDENDYNSLKSDEWVSYKKFVNGDKVHEDITSGEFKLSINRSVYTNRDKNHLSYESNMKLADNLYKQWQSK